MTTHEMLIGLGADYKTLIKRSRISRPVSSRVRTRLDKVKRALLSVINKNPDISIDFAEKPYIPDRVQVEESFPYRYGPLNTPMSLKASLLLMWPM